MTTEKKLNADEQKELLKTLEGRFLKNKGRHEGIEWAAVEARIAGQPEKLWTLNEMEKTGGEPDVVCFDSETGEYIFMDCAEESPKGRRSLCYDREALDGRKENKPVNSVLDMAREMGVELLTEEDYRELQKLGKFDRKTSSWIVTPVEIRKLGGAIFSDFRYNHVFVYHNGADSYYAARGFRGLVRV